MKLWVVRHAKPLIGTDVCYGAMDVPVDVQAAAELVRQLAAVVPLHAALVCSPARRCAQTGQVLAQQRPDLTLHIEPRLTELDFGHWQARRWVDIAQHEYEPWMADFGNHRVGGGESVNALMKRVSAALVHTRTLVATGEAVWITHAGVIQALTLLTRGVAQVTAPAQWPAASIGCGQWVLLDFAQL